MKKAIKISLLGILSVLIIGMAFMYFKFNNYAPGDGAMQVNETALAYYSDSYDDARAAFLLKVDKLKEQFDSVQVSNFQVASKTDSQLYVDVCYIPAQQSNSKLLILTSGLHGIEGYTGSAVQLMIIDKLLAGGNLNEVGVLFIHGLNPYGFKYGRKVTENNVDLNRNCVVNIDDFNTKNEGFGKLDAMLTPQGPVNLCQLKNQFFHLVAITKIVQDGMPVLRQAALQGQYDYPGGIYYGSKDYEPQIKSIQPILKKVINQYPTVLNIDLHTGYGQRDKMHLFLDPVDDENVMNGLNTIFAGIDIDWGGGDDFYTINGEYVELVSSLADSALVMPMLFEFGTMNSKETFGSLKSIHIMITENQGANFGYKNERMEKKVKANMMELYCPTSEAWRSHTIQTADVMFDKVLGSFEKYN